MPGTLLNTATVLVGSLIGLGLGSQIPEAYLGVALTGLGMVNIGMGVKMFLETKNILVLAIAVGLGGILGAMLGINAGLDQFAEWARQSLGGGETFNDGLITASVLFCIGPMTLLGCIQDGLERKSDLLALKSTLDGIASVFLAATLGIGVLVSAAVVLVLQGLLTLLAKQLAPLAKDPEYLAEVTAVGGVLLMMIGLTLAEVKKLSTATYLPALILAPILVAVWRRWERSKPQEQVA